MNYATGETPMPGDVIKLRGAVTNHIRVAYIGVNGLGWEELNESDGGGGLRAETWSLVSRDPYWAKKRQDERKSEFSNGDRAIWAIDRIENAIAEFNDPVVCASLIGVILQQYHEGETKYRCAVAKAIKSVAYSGCTKIEEHDGPCNDVPFFRSLK
jgi:hypothetical protein